MQKTDIRNQRIEFHDDFERIKKSNYKIFFKVDFVLINYCSKIKKIVKKTHK